MSGGEWSCGIINGERATIDSISNLDISVDASSDAYGIFTESAFIESITDTSITVSSTSGKAYGYYSKVDEASDIANFSGSITVSSEVEATALYLSAGRSDSAYTFNFNDDTTLIATSTSGTANAIAISQNALSYTLTASRDDITINMTGDISASDTILTLASGNYVMNSDANITASSMSISSGASLTLNGATTFDIGDGALINYGTINADAAYLDSSSISKQEGSSFGITSGTLSSALSTYTGVSVQIVEGATASASANYIDSALTNAGTLNLTSGTLGAAITGDGSTVIAADNSVSTNAAYLGTELTNNGTLELTGGTLSNDITMTEGASLSTTDTVSLVAGASVSSSSITLTSTSAGATANIADWSGDSISNATISNVIVTITSSSSDDTGMEAATQSVAVVQSALFRTKAGTDNETATTEGASFTDVSFLDTEFILEDGSTLTLTNVSIDADCSFVLSDNASATINATDLTVSTSDISIEGSTITIGTFDVDGAITVNVDGTFTVNLVMDEEQLLDFQSLLDEYDSVNFDFSELASYEELDALNIAITDASDIDLSEGNVYEFSFEGSDLIGGSIDISTSDIIPEPSTATLSLLALAGLCARRRRKAA